jgi:hypothetical protein
VVRIDRIEIYRVRLPLIYPFMTAYGDASVIESVLVCLVGGGVLGWGESTPW